MSLPLSGKIALITGGSKGIGAALSTRLASLGANVAINYSSDSAAAETLVNTLNNTSRGPPDSNPQPVAIAIQADASTIQGAETMVAAVVERYSKIDILICCAGVLPMKTLSSTTEEDFDRTYALNVKGPYFLAQKALPHMPTAPSSTAPSSAHTGSPTTHNDDAGSRIIFFSTSLTAASTVQPSYTLYNGTKGAIEQLSRVLSKDLVGRGITVNCVAPGPTGTELFLRGKPQEVVSAIGKLSPRGRIGDPDEVADAVALLCGRESRWISGQVLRINGGMA